MFLFIYYRSPKRLRMSSNDVAQLRHFRSLYLNLNGADLWFIVDGERIPSHKLILTATIPYYKKILAENNDHDESHITGVSVESFKEFLKFVYLVKPELTTDNIEGVMSMARRWQSDEIFAECEEFLKRSLIDKSMLFFGYRLALAYEAKHLKRLFQNEICANATNAFKSVSFLTLPQEFLAKILECNRLACKEIEIFNACIAWASAACIRNGLDSPNVEDLRNQLGDSLYQIRFTSMTNEEAATCIASHPHLFTAIELQEILSMVGQRKQCKAKKFNWTIRYYDLNLKSNLICSRLRDSDDCKSTYNIQNVEITEFTCDRDIVLHGIELEMHHNAEQSIHIRIDERNKDLLSSECYSERSMARFAGNQLTTPRDRRNAAHSNSCVARIPLNRGILLRANYTYTITITFNDSHTNSNLLSRRRLKEKVRVDCDTVFWFNKRGIVSALTLRRFDDRTCCRKIIHSPTFWMLFIAMTLIFCFGAAVYISSDLRAQVLKYLPVAWPYTQFALYISFGLLVIVVRRTEIYATLITVAPQLGIAHDPYFYVAAGVIASLCAIYISLGLEALLIVISPFFVILFIFYKIANNTERIRYRRGI